MTRHLVLVVEETEAIFEPAQTQLTEFAALERLLKDELVGMSVIDDDGTNRLVDPQRMIRLDSLVRFLRQAHPQGSPLTNAIEDLLAIGPDPEHALIDARMHDRALCVARSI